MDPLGKCHLCDEPRPLKPIRWCGMCKHYFCEDCRSAYWKRFDAAVMQLIKGRERQDCCGPQEAM